MGPRRDRSLVKRWNPRMPIDIRPMMRWWPILQLEEDRIVRQDVTHTLKAGDALNVQDGIGDVENMYVNKRGFSPWNLSCSIGSYHPWTVNRVKRLVMLSVCLLWVGCWDILREMDLGIPSVLCLYLCQSTKVIHFTTISYYISLRNMILLVIKLTGVISFFKPRSVFVSRISKWCLDYSSTCCVMKHNRDGKHYYFNNTVNLRMNGAVKKVDCPYEGKGLKVYNGKTISTVP